MDRLDDVNKDWNIMGGILDIHNDPHGLRLVRSAYFENRTFHVQSDLPVFTEMIGDRDFRTDFVETAETIQKSNLMPLYLYYFNYTTKAKADLSIGHLLRIKHQTGLRRFLPSEVNIFTEAVGMRLREDVGLTVPNYGVCHGDELKYLFMLDDLVLIKPGSPNYLTSKLMVRMWTQFATNRYSSSNKVSDCIFLLAFSYSLDTATWTNLVGNRQPMML